MKTYSTKIAFVLGCIGSLMVCGSVRAALIPIGSFVGNLSETWESFPNYQSGGFHYESSPASIMGGSATISNPFMAVYQPGVADFGLGFNGVAGVSDGVRAMGVDRSSQTATISFSIPVFDFGAYWGNASSIVSLSFSDGSSASFSYSRPGDGLLEWHGWNSTIGISSVSYTGDYVVIDGLQANTAPVPEPSTYIAGALLLLPFGIQAIRRLHAPKRVSP